MNQVTKSTTNRMAVVFDFDRTLIPDDSFYVLLQDCQIDIDAFVRDRLQPLVDDGWNKYLAKAYCLVRESQQREANQRITKSKLLALGQKLKLCDGVADMFESLPQQVREVNPDIELELYMISGGFADIARGTSIARYFNQIWGSEFHYNDRGEIDFIKRQMTHTEKTRYLYYLSKGTDTENEKDLIYNYQDLPTDRLHLPLSQVIYVGDGSSDVPCFSVINEYGGIALGIYSPDRTAQQWKYADEITPSQKLAQLVPANYQPDSKTSQALALAIESIGKKIALSQIS